MANNLNNFETTFGRLAFPIVIVLGSIILGFFVNPLWVWSAVAAIMLASIMLGHSGNVLFLFWLWASVAPLLTQYLQSSIVGYLDELLMIMVIIVFMGSTVLQRKKVPDATGFIRLFIGLLAVSLISFLWNEKIPLNTFQALFTYYIFPFILLTALLLFNPTRRLMSIFLKSVLGLFLVHVVLNIGWFLRINPLINRFWYSTVDFAQGTFASASWAAYFSIIIIFICLNAGVRSHGKTRVYWFGGMLLGLLNFYLSHTNHGYALIAILYLLFIMLFPNGRTLKIGLALCALVIALVLPVLEQRFMSTEQMEYQENITDVLSSEGLSLRWRMFKLSPKIRLLDRIVVQNARNTPMEWLIGMGPGLGVSVVGMSKVSPKALEYLGEYYLSSSGRMELADGSIMSSAYSGIFSIWSEVGLLGFIFYVGLYVYPWVRVWRQYRCKVYVDTLQILLVEAYLLAIPLFLMVNILTDLFWPDYYVVGLWIWAALIWRPVLVAKEEQIQANSMSDTE